MTNEILEIAIKSRLVERAVMIGFVFILSIAILVGFWRRTQKFDFDISKDKMSTSASIVLSTPVLILFALVLFSFFLFSSTISVSNKNNINDDSKANLYTGAVAGGAKDQEIDPLATAPLRRMLGHVNCVISRADDLSDAEIDAFATVKARLMLANWPISWGDAIVFRQWALEGNDSVQPNSNAIEAFNARDLEC